MVQHWKDQVRSQDQRRVNHRVQCSTVAQRGGFAKKHIWVTAFDPAEKYASGDYPNVHAGGDGLPKYVAQNRDIENADVVLWHSFGHTHVCKPEDFPIMPVEYAGFTLKPNGFFDANIAMDLPADKTRNFFTPTLVNTGTELVLFDTGLAPEGITGALAAAGYTPDQVDVVVLTHMHGDHIGGLMAEMQDVSHGRSTSM